MATNVDERIVAAKFDASDFEKGVDKTIKKLDELKKELNLKETGKNVEELAKKTEASTESMGKSLDKLTERFTTFVGMVKQKILSGLADEVAGVFLKLEQSVTGFIRSISSDQVSAGMSKYEQMLTSVRIMMSAGESQSAAYSSIDQLREYSDQTSYSLSQMTDALSKMRSAGVDLDTATRSVEGIANACANAGINATDAQRAFYNLAQAYGKGTLNYTDYKSLELLNMTTEKFKEDLLEAAAEAGTLKKVSDGVYKTVSTTDKKVKAGKKVTVKNLQDMLKYDFVNNEAMNKLFGKKFYFDEKEFKKYKKKWTNEKGEVDREKAIAEAKKDFGEIAVDAYLAAREARSFTDVINTLKDVVSTGWGTTFEHLFGKLEEAKDFFTNLAEGELADVVYKIGEYRNAILGFWNDGVGDKNGGKVFRDTIINITDALGTLLKTFLQILPGFDELNNEEGEAQPILESIGDKLFQISMRIRTLSKGVKEAAYNFNAFMHTPLFDGKEGPTRIEAIRQVLANLSSVFGIIGKVVVIAFQTISKAFYTLSPIFDGFLVLLSKVTEPLVDLKNNSTVFKDLEHGIDNVFIVLEPVANVLGQVIGFLGDIGKFIAQMAIDTFTMNIQFFADALGLVLELLGIDSAQMKDVKAGGGVIAGIRRDFEGIKDACSQGLSAVKEFFGALIGDIRRLLGLQEEATQGQDDQNGGVFSGLINFFNTNQFVQDAKKWVNQAIIDVGNFVKSIPERVMQFGANIYDTLRNLFFTEQTKYNGSQLETKTILTPLGEWITKAIEDVKAFFKSLPQRIIDGVGKIGSWIDEVFDSWFNGNKANTGAKSSADDKNKVVNKDSAIMQRFENFIEETKKVVAAWFEDLPNKIQNAFQTIGDFATNLFKALNEFLFGNKVTKLIKEVDPLTGKTSFRKITVTYKKGFSKWLDGAIKDIKKFIQKIPEYVKAGIKGAGDIISTVIGALFGKPEDKNVTNKDVEDRIKKPFLGIDLTSVLDTIKDIGTTLLNQIARIFTGTDDVEANSEWFANIVATGIEWIRTKAKTALDWVLDFIVTIPTKIANLFKGENSDNKEQGPIGKAISDFGRTIGEFISDIPTTIVNFFNEALIGIGDLWDKLYKTIIGESEEVNDKTQKYAENEFGYPVSYSHRQTKSKWDKFVESLGKLISTAFEELPVWIAQGIDIAVTAIDEMIGGIGTWIKGIGIQKEVEKTAETVTSEATEGMAKSAEDGEDKEEPKLVTAIKNIGERIKTLFVETIPKFIQDAWIAISKLGSEVFEGLSSIFTGETPKSEVGKAVGEFGQTIYDFITNDIPNFLKKAFRFIEQLFGGASNNIGKIGGDFDVFDPMANNIKKRAKAANKKIEKDTEKSGFWSFVDSIKNGFLSAVESIGPAVLNGISTALDWIGNIVDFIVKAITGEKTIGEQVEEVYGEEKPELRNALNNIGESLRKFFLDTIPTFLGSAIGTLAANAGEWLSKLFSAFHTAADAEEKKQAKEAKEAEDKSPEDVAKDFVTIFTEFFNNELFKMGVDAVKAIAIVVAITVLLRTLKDIFSLADEAEAAADVVKWTALAIAFSGLVGILNAVTSLLGSGEDDKVAAAERFLDKIGGLLEKVAWIVGLLTAGKLIEAISAPGGGTMAEKLLGVVTGPLTTFFTAIAGGAGASIAGGMISSTISSMFEDITSSFNELVFSIDDAISIISPLADKLTSMYDPLSTAIESINKISELFKTFYQAFGHMYTEASGKSLEREPGTDIYTTGDEQIVIGGTEFTAEIEAFLKNLQSRVELFNVLSVFIDHIATSLQKFSSIPNVNDELDSMMGVLTDGKFSEFLTKMLNILRKCLDDSGLSAKKLGVTEYMVGKYTSGLAIGLEILANSLEVFANGISGITVENITAFDKTLDVFNRLAETFKGSQATPGMIERFFTGDTTLSAIGAEIKMFGFQMKSFYGYIKGIPGFEEGEADKTNQVVGAVVDFAGNIVKVMQMYFGFTGNSLRLFDEVCQKLPTFGEYIAKFYEALNRGFELNGNGFTNGRINMLVGAAEGAASILQAINGLADLMLIDNDMPDRDLGDILDGIFNTIEPGKITDINKLASLIEAFDMALIKVMETEDFADSYKTIGQNVASKLAEGIQSAFDEDPELRIQITPVFKLDDDTKAQLRQQLTDAGFEFNTASLAASAQGANSATDAERITATLFTEQMTTISTAINDLKSAQTTVDQLTTAMTHIGVYLNKSILLGAIGKDVADIADEIIGMKISQINMGITPS